MWIDQFISAIKKSTIDACSLGHAYALKDANLPKYLYRYRPICGEPGKWALKNLQDDTAWICSPDAYNDPYDCLFRIAEDDVRTAVLRNLFPHFVRIYKLKKIVSRTAITEARACDNPIQYLLNAIPTGHVFAPGSDPVAGAGFMFAQVPKRVQETSDVIRQIRRVTKVCAFSERNDSIVMWSHYANDHRGMCIEYDISALHPNHALRHNVFPVVYSSGLFNLTRWVQQLMRKGTKGLRPAMVLLPMMHKYKDWQYEQEWRYILTEDRLTPDRALQVPKPTRLFLGTRVPDDKKKVLIDICVRKSIEVWQMALSLDAFVLKSSRIA